jgi:hypothetical protein
VGKRVKTAEGEGKVIRQNVMKQLVMVVLEDGREMEFNLSDLLSDKSKKGNHQRHGGGKGTNVTKR